MPDENSFLKIPTGVSGAYWCDPEKPNFEKARRPEFATPQVCWLDELLAGGIAIPNTLGGGPNRAVTMLLTGPPGTGKSTLAIELCYRWACAKDQPLRHFYYATTEANPLWLIENARQLWGKDVEDRFKENIEVVEYVPSDVEPASSNRTELALAGLLGLRGIKLAEDVRIFTPTTILGDHSPDVVIVDSLNVISDDPHKKEWLKEISAVVRNERHGPKLVILIMDWRRFEGVGVLGIYF